MDGISLNDKVEPGEIFRRPLSPFMSPHAYHCCAIDGHVHCIARREGAFRNRRVVFYLEGDRHNASATPLFVAQKRTDGKFYIFNVSEHSSIVNYKFKKREDAYAYVGKIERTKFIT